MTTTKETFDIRKIDAFTAGQFLANFHKYGAASLTTAIIFGIFEDNVLKGVFAYQVPPFGAGNLICPECPQAVISLTRMAAVDKKDRKFQKISKVLREIHKNYLDRTRYPIIVAYADRGLGHEGNCYKYAGFQLEGETVTSFYVDQNGNRYSRNSNGKHVGGRQSGKTIILRYVHRICEKGEALNWLTSHGWRLVPTNKTRQNGKTLNTWRKIE